MVGCLTSALPSRPPTPRPWLYFKPHPLLGSPTDAGSAHSAAIFSIYLPLVGDLFMSFLSRVGILCFCRQSFPALPPDSLSHPPPPPSGAGVSGCARRGPRRVDTLSSSSACCVPQRGGARSAREQRAMGTNPRRRLRLPAPPTRPALLAAGGRARGCSWKHSGPGTRAQRSPWKPRAALERRLDSAPPEDAEARAAGALRDRLNLRAGRGQGGHCSFLWVCLSVRPARSVTCVAL